MIINITCKMDILTFSETKDTLYILNEISNWYIYKIWFEELVRQVTLFCLHSYHYKVSSPSPLIAGAGKMLVTTNIALQNSSHFWHLLYKSLQNSFQLQTGLSPSSRMNRDNRQSVTDEPVEFWEITSWSSRGQGKLPIVLKQSIDYTSNWWRKPKRSQHGTGMAGHIGFWPIMPKNLPGHWSWMQLPDLLHGVHIGYWRPAESINESPPDFVQGIRCMI